MIGYDATNVIGQSISIREKIYLFSLSYFAFIYKSLPLFSFKFISTDTIVENLSEKIFLYYKIYVVTTEASEEEKRNKKYTKKALAKYYLAAIYYYEPAFDFESADLAQIEELGEIYLKQLFQENIIYFIKNSTKENAIYSLSYDKKWKYFAHALLISEYGGQFLNIIQQPLSYPSRKDFLWQDTAAAESKVLNEINFFLVNNHKIFRKLQYSQV